MDDDPDSLLSMFMVRRREIVSERQGEGLCNVESSQGCVCVCVCGVCCVSVCAVCLCVCVCCVSVCAVWFCLFLFNCRLWEQQTIRSSLISSNR